MVRRWLWPALPIALLFVLAGLPLLRQAGLHVDASSELACPYTCSTPAYEVDLLGFTIPLMVIQYQGALKAWLFYPILQFLEVNEFTLRLPTLLLGAASVWLLYSLLERTHSRRAAVIGALLLATDATFLLSSAYDFGPVALLHFLMLAGILSVLRYEQTRKLSFLALGFFLFGLALWEKSLFLWMLGGLGVATLAVFPRRVSALATPKALIVAFLAMCFGALPLIWYNVDSGGGTFHVSRVRSPDAPFGQKVLILRRSLDGSVWFSFLTDENPATPDRPPGTPMRATAVRLARLAGSSISSWTLLAFALSVCLLPWLWFTKSRRPALFATIYMAVTWAQMLILSNTGAAVQHSILLWPFPQFLIAVAGAQVSWSAGRRGAVALAAALCLVLARNVLLIDQYYARLITKGTTVVWTEAVDTLATVTESMPGSRFAAVDWGYGATLCLLTDGEIPLSDISYELLDRTPDTTPVRKPLEDPRMVFIEHAPGCELFPGVHARLDAIAGTLGLTRDVIRTIADRNGRPRFELVRYHHE